MILSMTGFGQDTIQIGKKNYRIEIKSLNGKTTDIRFKSALNLREKELELRKLITESAKRGKFDVSLIAESSTGSEEYFLNKELMNSYYSELRSFANEKGLDYGDMLQSIIRMPNIVQLVEDEISDEEWQGIRAMVERALDKLRNFRMTEGQSLKRDILEKTNSILNLLEQIDKYEAERIENLRERIKKNLNQYLSKENVDKNRFEQEIIFYLEKLDINEEKVRLKQHCHYFNKEAEKDVELKGKKLSFITQEIGREVNTLGAKAQHPEIQQIVVRMKDDLEKVKEQVLNIL